MRNTSIRAAVQQTMAAACTLFLSTAATVAIANPIDTQGPSASLIDQLLSPPAPLLNTADTNPLTQMTEQARHWFSFNDSGLGWKFAIDQSSPSQAPPIALNELQRLSSTLLDQAKLHAADQDASRRFGQWLTNAAQNSNFQIGGKMPIGENLLAQMPAEAITAAINSREVTHYLEKDGKSMGLLAQLLGWQKTGLLPTATDLQKMASDQVGAMASSIERWTLQNVSFSATSHAVADADTQQMQWQWSVTNSTQYNSNSVADNEANFSANLRRLFGMNDYYGY